jgi:chromosome segregation ATPase
LEAALRDAVRSKEQLERLNQQLNNQIQQLEDMIAQLQTRVYQLEQTNERLESEKTQLDIANQQLSIDLRAARARNVSDRSQIEVTTYRERRTSMPVYCLLTHRNMQSEPRADSSFIQTTVCSVGRSYETVEARTRRIGIGSQLKRSVTKLGEITIGE